MNAFPLSNVLRDTQTFRILCVLLLTTITVSAYAQIALPKSMTKTKLYTAEELRLLTPKSANPYLAYLPSGVEPDWEYWRSAMILESQERSAVLSLAPILNLINLTETETNDTQATADFVAGFGTGAGDDPAVDISGSITTVGGAPTDLGSFLENPALTTDDGKIDDGAPSPAMANLILVPDGFSVTVNGIVGDGLHGSDPTADSQGDYDFYRINGLALGDFLSVDVDTVDPLGPLDSVVVVWDDTGVPIAFNDDTDASNLDSFTAVTIPLAGNYFVMIGGFHPNGVAPSNPFAPASGPGLGSEGPYAMTIGLNTHDVDFFTFDLEAGDVLGAVGASSANVLTLFDPATLKRLGSSQDLSALYPAASPLPGGSGGVLSYVVETTGTYAVSVSASPGAYALQLRVFRPPLDSAGIGERQIFFIDFDGASFDRTIFGGFGTATLSPLLTFLPNWGLTALDESAVIDAILASVTENIQTDIAAMGLNPNFDVQILNSRDDADIFGTANVSRVIVGGTTGELGTVTIELSESIDVGNFATRETAVVLLDLLSAAAPSSSSLNSITLDASVDIIDLIGVAVGNFVAHGVGHLIGNFHTDASAPATLMDRGGNLTGLIGVGADSIFGTVDDADVDFAVDLYTPDEFFSGTEDTINVLSFDMTTNPAGGPIPLRIVPLVLVLAAAGIWAVRRRRWRSKT